MTNHSTGGRRPGPNNPQPRARGWLILAILLVVVAVGLLIYYVQPRRPDCTFSGWKRAIGVDMDAKVGDLQTMQAKLGLTDSEVREFDTLLKDYAAKYDAACNDFKNGRMNQAEYTCRRRNMDQVLDAIRISAQAVEAAKGIADPQEQARQIKAALQQLGAASKAGYGAGCVSAITIDPDSVTFAAQTPERSIHIGNGGNNDFTFAIDGLPEAFLAQPTSGAVPRGAQPVTVSIYRTILPLDTAHPTAFRVRNNFEEEHTIQIIFTGSSTTLYEQLGAAATARAAGQKPTVEDALAVVDPILPPNAADRSAARYFLAMNVLTQAGRQEQALEAYQTAVVNNPALTSNSAALLSRGVVLSRKGDADRAVESFARAQEVPGRADDPAKSAAAVLAASAEIKRGNTAEAEAHLRAPGVEKRILADSSLKTFTLHEFPGRETSKIWKSVSAETKK